MLFPSENFVIVHKRGIPRLPFEREREGGVDLNPEFICSVLGSIILLFPTPFRERDVLVRIHVNWVFHFRNYFRISILGIHFVLGGISFIRILILIQR